MKKITFEELCMLVAHIDYIDSSSYPVSFIIKNKGKESRRFECGIGKADNNVWFCKSFGGETELQYMLSEKDGIVDLQDPDIMVFDEICEMLKAKCEISVESEILLNEEVSFDGEELYINEKLLSDKLIKELVAANEEPNLKSLWHNTGEEPMCNELLLGEDTDGFSIYRWCGQEDNWEAFVNETGLSRWAYIDDLLPKGDIK